MISTPFLIPGEMVSHFYRRPIKLLHFSIQHHTKTLVLLRKVQNKQAFEIGAGVTVLYHKSAARSPLAPGDGPALPPGGTLAYPRGSARVPAAGTPLPPPRMAGDGPPLLPAAPAAVAAPTPAPAPRRETDWEDGEDGEAYWSNDDPGGRAVDDGDDDDDAPGPRFSPDGSGFFGGMAWDSACAPDPLKKPCMKS